MVANRLENKDSSLVLLVKWKEELLILIFLYVLTNYRNRQGVENYVSSSGWVR